MFRVRRYTHVMTLKQTPLTALQSDAVKHLRKYTRPGEAGRQTADLRAVAASFVAAREHFFTRDGLPDWTGRTHGYRHWVRETMSLASVPPADVSSLQASIRYHSGAALRAHLDAGTVEELGLRPESPRERSAVKREQIAERLNLVSGGRELTDAEEIDAALGVIEATVRRIDAGAVAGSAELREAVARIVALLNDLSHENGGQVVTK